MILKIAIIEYYPSKYPSYSNKGMIIDVTVKRRLLELPEKRREYANSSFSVWRVNIQEFSKNCS